MGCYAPLRAGGRHLDGLQHSVCSNVHFRHACQLLATEQGMRLASKILIHQNTSVWAATRAARCVTVSGGLGGPRHLLPATPQDHQAVWRKLTSLMPSLSSSWATPSMPWLHSAVKVFARSVCMVYGPG